MIFAALRLTHSGLITLLAVFCLLIPVWWEVALGSEAQFDVLRTAPVVSIPWEMQAHRQYLNLDGVWLFKRPMDTTWLEIPVPVNFAAIDLGLDRYVGASTYLRVFDVPRRFLGQRVRLHFWGVNYRFTAYVNERLAGQHEGGHTPAAFDVTDLLTEGSNVLRVDVSNVIGLDDLFIGDWWNYGGIHREVFLEATEDTHITDVTIVTDLNRSGPTADVTLSVQLVNPDPTARLEAQVYRVRGDDLQLVATQIMPQSESPKIVFALDEPDLWSPETPNLYLARVVLGRGSVAYDDYAATFGVRRFEIIDGQFYLNGRPVFLHGINKHDEYPLGAFPRAGRVMSIEQRIADLERMKDLGVNAARLAHYPNHPYNLDLADRLGIMIIDENTVIGGFLNDARVRAKAVAVTEEMVRRDKNHASVVLWSIGNEFNAEANRAYVQEAAARVRELDGTRPITFTDFVDDPTAYNYVDVVCRNEYGGWYQGRIEDVETVLAYLHERYPKHPIVILETGAEAVAGWHTLSGPPVRGTEEFQADFLRRKMQVVRRTPYVAGEFVWVFADFHTKNPIGSAQFTPFLNQKGVVGFNRELKLGYYMLQWLYHGGDEQSGPPERLPAPPPTFRDDFGDTPVGRFPARWRDALDTGGWTVGDHNGHVLRQSGAAGRRYLAVADTAPDGDFSLQTDVEAPGPDGIGLIFCYQDADNFYGVELSGGWVARLFKQVNGEPIDLAGAIHLYPFNRRYTLQAYLRDAWLHIFLNGVPVLAVEEGCVAPGATGVFSRGPAEFTNVLISPHEE